MQGPEEMQLWLWSQRSLGGGNDNSFQCSCTENPMNRRSLAGYIPWGCRVWHDWGTEQTHEDTIAALHSKTKECAGVKELVDSKVVILSTPWKKKDRLKRVRAVASATSRFNTKFRIYDSRSLRQSLSHVFVTPWTAAHRLPCPLPTHGAYSNSCPLSQWCHPTTSSSVIPFSSCPPSFLASGSFPKSHLFASGGQSIVASALASIFPMNTQDWFPLGLTGWISKQSKELFSLLQHHSSKHQFFGTHLSL